MAAVKPWPCCSRAARTGSLYKLQTQDFPSLSSLVTRTNTRVVLKASRWNQPLVSNSGSRSSSTEDFPPPGCSRIKVELKKPLGLTLEEDASGSIFVAEVLPGGNAEKSGLVEAGDQLIATSAVVYNDQERYQGVTVRKGMEVIRFNVRGEKFDTIIAAIGTHPGYMKVTLELQKCKPRSDNGGLVESR